MEKYLVTKKNMEHNILILTSRSSLCLREMSAEGQPVVVFCTLHFVLQKILVNDPEKI
jgi:hypothetical protein